MTFPCPLRKFPVRFSDNDVDRFLFDRRAVRIQGNCDHLWFRFRIFFASFVPGTAAGTAAPGRFGFFRRFSVGIFRFIFQSRVIFLQYSGIGLIKRFLFFRFGSKAVENRLLGFSESELFSSHLVIILREDIFVIYNGKHLVIVGKSCPAPAQRQHQYNY